jgi:RNA polymerase sigma factor (sigma-70 family)
MGNASRTSEEFESIVRDTSSHIFSLSFRLTGSYDEAHDLLQDTYLKAWQKRDNLKDGSKAAAWIRKICVNQYIDNYRESKRKYLVRDPVFPHMDYEIASDAPSPEDELIADEEVRLIHSQCWTIMTRTLPIYQQVALILVDVYRLGTGEAARLIGRSDAATKSLLHRARKAMYERIAPVCGLLQQDNICKCSSWVKFSHDIERRRVHLKEIVEKRAASGAAIESSPEELTRFFNTLPRHIPPHEWVDEMIKKFSKERI